ncbi:MAG: hypothetical protein WD844_01175 [Thermoleophilaceae bacterium]
MTFPPGLARTLPIAALALFGGGAGGLLPWWAGIGGGVLAVAAFGAAHVARRRGGRRLLISLAAPAVRRGERVSVRLDLARGAGETEALEVGLVCGVRYAVREYRRRAGGDRDLRRTIKRDTAYEAFKPATPGQPVELVVPREMPYSHEGQELGFTWRVVARDARALRPDPSADVALQVLP